MKKLLAAIAVLMGITAIWSVSAMADEATTNPGNEDLKYIYTRG